MTTPAAPQDSPSHPLPETRLDSLPEQPSAVIAPQPSPASETGLPDEFEELTPELVEDEAIRGDFVLRWAVVLLAFLLASTKVGDASTLVEIKTGQYLASHGFLPPQHDVFSSTATDRLWPNLSWGFDLILGAVYSVAGFAGVSVFKALVVAAAFLLVSNISRQGLPTWWSSICAALALLAAHLRMSAHPTIVTLLGLAAVFYLLHRYHESARLSRDGSGTGSSRSLWGLVAVFLVWCNLDSRAFLGLACVLLYALGEAVAGVFQGSAFSRTERRHLWIVAAGCAAVTLIHPWTWRSLLSPLQVYGTEYTAIREFTSFAYLGEPQQVYPPQSFYFPLSYGALWERFDLAALGAVAVILLGVCLFLLNLKRVVWGEVFAFAGMLAFATLCLRELPAAALVAAIFAGLNGQSWYQANFKQEYTTNALELLFSRGGRAVTVLAFAGLAFFAGTGRLREATAPQTGYGIDQNLSSLIGDLQARLIGAEGPTETAETVGDSDERVERPTDGKGQAGTGDTPRGPRSFDDRPFNFGLDQGDILIWIGQKPFVDTRFAVYHHSDREQNLLATHQRVRQALRTPRVTEGLGRSLTGGDSGQTAKEARRRRDYWHAVLDQHQITHALLRLSSSSQAVQEFAVLSDLLNADSPEWKLTDLGANCAVLYRTDRPDEALSEFVKRRAIDFKDLAYRREGKLLSARDRWVRSPSFYQRYLWSERREMAPAIQQAMQYARMATLPPAPEPGLPLSIPREFAASRAALAILAVQGAQDGLQDDPDSVWGYLVLGQAYSVLAKWEAELAQNSSRSPFTGMRYLQTVAAFSQALIADPDDARAHQQLAALYQQANRPDLELRHQKKLRDLFEEVPEADQLVALDTRVSELEKLVAAADEDDEQFQQQGRDPMERAMYLTQKGFVLKALTILDQFAEARTGNLQAEQMRIILQIEAGRCEEAHEAAERFSQPAAESRLPNWQDPVAFANLPNADYPRVRELWLSKADEAAKSAFSNLLVGLIPRPSGLAGWPLATMSSAAGWYFQKPDIVSETRLNLALVFLEHGQLAAAQQQLELALAANPETPSRSLILHYLVELKGTDDFVEPFPPSQTIPGLFASEEEFSARERFAPED